MIGTHRLLSKDVAFRTSGWWWSTRSSGSASRRRSGSSSCGRAVDVLTLSRDADPADAQPGAGRDPRPERHRDAAGGPAADPDPGRGGVRRARARRDPARARPRRPGVLRPQPGRDDRGAGRAAPAAAAGRADRRRPRADGRGRAREGHAHVRRRRRGRPRVHDDHRVRPRHPEREHDRHRPRRHARARPALPAPRPGRAVVAARVRVPALPAARADERGGAQAAAGDLQRLGAGRRVPDRARRPRDPRARATSWAASSRGSWRRSGSTSTRGCWRRRSRRRRRGARTASRCARCRRRWWTCRSTRTCPDDYVPDEAQKLELYRRLARARSAGDVAAFRQEVTDRYGPMPTPVLRLVEVAELRLGRRDRRRRVAGARGGLAGRALRGRDLARDGDAAARSGAAVGAPLPGVRPGDMTFASNQVRIRLPRDPLKGWTLTQAVVSRLVARRRRLERPRRSSDRRRA